MKPKVTVLVLVCFAPQLLFAQSAAPPAQSKFVVWQVASPALTILTPDEQAFVRLNIIGRQFTAERKSEAAERVVDAVQQLGYFQAQVRGSELAGLEPSHPERVELRLALELGPQFRFGQLKWKGVTAFPPDQLALLTPMTEGDVFDTERVRLLLHAVKRMYAAVGNNQVMILPVPDIDNSASTVALTLDVLEHPEQR